MKKRGKSVEIENKTQQHFRGSSFGQASVPKTSSELRRAYEYGSNGFTQEESSDSVRGAEEHKIYNLDKFRDKINQAIESEAYFQNSRKSGQESNSKLYNQIAISK